MRTLTRYLTLELVGWLVIVLLLLTALLVLVVVAGEASRMNLGFGPTLKLLPFVLPTALAYALPCALLFTICLVYGRMSADNEVVATKALGISPVVLLWPAWVLAFGLSLVGVWLTDLAFSWGTVGVQRVVVQSVEQIAYGMLRTQKSYANQRFSITVKDVVGRRLIRPEMNFQANNDMPAMMISAAEAELQTDLARNMMILVLIDGHIEGGRVQGYFPGREVHEVPLAYLAARDFKEGNPAQLALRRLTGETVAQERRIDELEQSLAAETAVALVAGEFEKLDEQTWKQRRRQLADARLRLFRLRTEPWRRWANGFSALCFVLVGAPLAILLKKSDVMTTFGWLFLPLLVIYYPLFIGCCDRAKAGDWPAYVVCVPNVLLLVVGMALQRWVVRY
jgi:lipopolysaccharide export system permease protein